MSNEIQSIDDIDPRYSKDYSEDNFWDKIIGCVKSAGLELVYKALQLYYAMDNPNCPMGVKAGIIAALGYFISPIDFIPDFIPVVGFTDDLAAIGAAIVMAHMYIDDNVKCKAREKIDDIFGKGTSDVLVEDNTKEAKEAKKLNAESSSTDIVAKLKELKGLRDLELISQDEYDRKKEELLKCI